MRRGTSLQVSDRTAGDSSPVTQENDRPRGRPGPIGGKMQKCTRAGSNGCGGRFHPARCVQSPTPDSPPPGRPKSPPGQPHCLRHPDRPPEVQTCRPPRARRGADPAETGARIQRRNPPAPLPGTGAALTPVLTVKKGPVDPSRGALRHARGAMSAPHPRHEHPPPRPARAPTPPRRGSLERSLRSFTSISPGFHSFHPSFTECTHQAGQRSLPAKQRPVTLRPWTGPLRSPHPPHAHRKPRGTPQAADR